MATLYSISFHAELQQAQAYDRCLIVPLKLDKKYVYLFDRRFSLVRS